MAAALNRESLLDAVELGRVPLGVTERGLRRGLRALPPATQSIRVGWPAHFGPCDWLVQALYSRSKDGATPLLKLELRAAGLEPGSVVVSIVTHDDAQRDAAVSALGASPLWQPGGVRGSHRRAGVSGVSGRLR